MNKSHVTCIAFVGNYSDIAVSRGDIVRFYSVRKISAFSCMRVFSVIDWWSYMTSEVSNGVKYYFHPIDEQRENNVLHPR